LEIITVPTELLVETFSKTDLEQQTIIHCYHYPYSRLRIFPETVLVQENHKLKKLIKVFNISMHPEWTPACNGLNFTLIFEPLDKDCKAFDIFEDIGPNRKGHFFYKDIVRSLTDVYKIRY